MKRITDGNLETIAITHQVITILLGEFGSVYVCLTKPRETGLVSSPLFSYSPLAGEKGWLMEGL
ncbi:MAG: hypothetical protein LUQ55_03200 [Methanomassiliicoccales archaeon]|nr:hypothetical protein [Methanomassiliicoccales archaeon]